MNPTDSTVSAKHAEITAEDALRRYFRENSEPIARHVLIDNIVKEYGIPEDLVVAATWALISGGELVPYEGDSASVVLDVA